MPHFPTRQMLAVCRASAEDFITSFHPQPVLLQHLRPLFRFPPNLYIRAPVSFPVTAGLTIRSASGLFKAFGTQCLNLFHDRRAWEGRSEKGKIWRACRQNGPSYEEARHKAHLLLCSARGQASLLHKLFMGSYGLAAWHASRVYRGCEGQLSLTAPFTRMCSPDGSDH